jgi:SAM-dependent methyltransferase
MNRNVVSPRGVGLLACTGERKLARNMARTALALFLVLTLFAQDRHPITGRRYAGVMGVRGADWLVRPEREAEEQPDRALDLIGIAPGTTAADVGAGNGYITWRMARRAGPTGKVYAVDIQPEMLDQLRRNMRERMLQNVEPVLGAIDDPKLPPNALDLIVLVDVYHEFSEPQKMLRGMRAALKPDGRLVLLEYRAEDPDVPIRPEHKMTVQQVKAELEPEGFRLDKAIEDLPRQHILIFKKARG